MSYRVTCYILLTCIISGFVLSSCQEDRGLSAMKDEGQEYKLILEIRDEDIFLSAFYRYIEINFSSDALSLNDDVLSRFFDDFVEEQLLLFEAKSNNVMVSNSEVNRIIKQTMDDDILVFDNPQLHREWRQSLKNSLIVKKFISQYVLKDLNVQLKEIENYYESHKDKYMVPEELRVSQILVNSREEAQNVLAQLRRRADFHQLAQQYSISPESVNGGDMGYYRKGQLPPEFEKVIFTLKEGQYSTIIPSGYGYHIFLLEERRPSGLLSISEVRDSIRLKILQEKSNSQLKRYISKLKEEVPIKIHYKNLDFQYKTSLIKSGAKLYEEKDSIQPIVDSLYPFSRWSRNISPASSGGDNS